MAEEVIATIFPTVVSIPVLVGVSVTLLSLATVRSYSFEKKRLPPTIPGGWPILGNVLQLTEKKPHRTFAGWKEKYGPIFNVKTGSTNNLVVNNSNLAKEVLVDKYSSISTRKMPTSLQILTRNKTMVAMSDYGEEHRMLKKQIVNNLLGPGPQKANRGIREEAVKGMIDELFEEISSSTTGIVNVREYIKHSLFPFAMKQVFGYAPENFYVPEIGLISKWEMFDILVANPIQSVISIDWRNFFPSLSWIPNKSVEDEIRRTENRRTWTIRALVAEQRKLLKKRAPTRAYCDILLTEATHLSDVQLEMSVWEPIIESADTSLVTTEWAMHEIAGDSDIQKRLYREIQEVTGGERMLTEDDVPRLKLLAAVIKETLRVYTPVPLMPARYVHEEVQIGGYDIPAGWEVLINLYAISMDTDIWSDPESWKPDRMLDSNVDLGFKDFKVMPFGGGKRLCAGISQAMAIISMNIGSLVQHFEWTLPAVTSTQAAYDDEATVYLTTHKLHPLVALARPRVQKRLPMIPIVVDPDTETKLIPPNFETDVSNPTIEPQMGCPNHQN